MTEPERYLLPHFRESAAFRRGKTISSNINLDRVYDQISLAEEDIAKAAIQAKAIHSDIHTSVF